MDSNELFSKVSPVKLFFIAAIPGSVSMLASMLYSIFEGVFAGRYIGWTALAAINLAMPIVFINFSLADMIGVGSSVPISIALGRKDYKKANNIFTCSVLMIIGTGAVMGVIMFTTAPFLVRLMGADGELALLAAAYIRASAICSPVTTLVFAADNYLRICGLIRKSMFLNIFMSVTTVILLYVYIAVFQWSVAGAAFATSTAMAVCTVIAIFSFARGKLLLHFQKPVFSLAMVQDIIFCGTPAFLNNIAGRLTAIVMNLALMTLGGQSAVAVYGVLMYGNDMVQPLLYGICDSLQPAIGYNWGSGATKRVKSLIKCCFIGSAAVSITAAALMFSFPEQIVSLFGKNEDAAILQMAADALRLFCIAYFFRWFGFTTQSMLNAVNKPLPATVLSITNALVFPLILIALLWPLGLTGVWLNFTVTSVLVSVFAILLLHRNRWEHIQEETAKK